MPGFNLFSYLMLDICDKVNASCYGAERINSTEKCCPTCDDVKMAYQHKGWTLALQNIGQCYGKFILF